MNILFLYPWMSLGGAPNSTLTIAKGMMERGHRVLIFTRSGGIHESKLREMGIPYVSAPYSLVCPKLYHLNLRALDKLRKTIDEHSIDIVHAFHDYSYILSLFVAPLKNIPVFFTALWFLKEWRYPYYPGWIIFAAEEFKDQARHLFDNVPREMVVIPNRIDTSFFYPGIDYEGFKERYSLPDDGWKIAFMSRVSSTKINSLLYAVRSMEILHHRGKMVTLCIAGDGLLKDVLIDCINEVNAKANRTIVRFIGPVQESPEFLSWADVVLGIGRCAWEGMACGKPVIVVGENGFAGLVEPEMFDELAYYNFSGRNAKRRVPEDALANAIERIMEDREFYSFLSRYSRECVEKNYDYKAGVERIEKMYLEALKFPPLTRAQKFKVITTNIIRGYLPRLFYAAKIHINAMLGRGRPEDSVIP